MEKAERGCSDGISNLIKEHIACKVEQSDFTALGEKQQKENETLKNEITNLREEVSQLKDEWRKNKESTNSEILRSNQNLQNQVTSLQEESKTYATKSDVKAQHDQLQDQVDKVAAKQVSDGNDLTQFIQLQYSSSLIDHRVHKKLAESKWNLSKGCEELLQNRNKDNGLTCTNCAKRPPDRGARGDEEIVYEYLSPNQQKKIWRERDPDRLFDVVHSTIPSDLEHLVMSEVIKEAKQLGVNPRLRNFDHQEFVDQLQKVLNERGDNQWTIGVGESSTTFNQTNIKGLELKIGRVYFNFKLEEKTSSDN